MRKVARVSAPAIFPFTRAMNKTDASEAMIAFKSARLGGGFDFDSWGIRTAIA